MDSLLRLQTHRSLLANKSMKSADLLQHQSSKHTGSISRTEELCKPKLSLICESLYWRRDDSPLVIVLAEIMIDKKTVKALSRESDNTVSCQI